MDVFRLAFLTSVETQFGNMRHINFLEVIGEPQILNITLPFLMFV